MENHIICFFFIIFSPRCVHNIFFIKLQSLDLKILKLYFFRFKISVVLANCTQIKEWNNVVQRYDIFTKIASLAIDAFAIIIN